MGFISKKDGNRELLKYDQEKILKRELAKVLKGYGIELIKEVNKGQGSMSFTYRAKTREQKKLIIKCVVIDRTYNAANATRGTREVEHNDKKAFETEYTALLAMKNSDYCVHIYESFDAQEHGTVRNDCYLKINMTDRYYALGFIEALHTPFVTGYVEDSSLGYSVAEFSDIVNKWSDQYSADCVASWIGLCVSRCLCDMKKNNIGMHRDIKPPNILVDVRNAADMFECRFILADFGIAYLNTTGNEKIRKARVGTKGYRPCDEFMAHDWRDDQYMLGKTLCEYYGILKPGANGYFELENPEFWGESFRINRYGVRDIIFKMISEDPAKRYQTAEALVADFERVLNKMNQGKSQNTVPNYGEGAEKYDKHSFDEAIKLFKEALNLTQNPSKDPEPSVKPKGTGYGYVFEEKQQPPKAEKQQPPKAEPKKPTAEMVINQAASYIKKGQTEKARTLLSESGMSAHTAFNRLKGICSYLEGNSREAMLIFKRYTHIDMISEYFCFALESDTQEKFAILKDLFLKMENTHPYYPAVCYNLYTLYRNTEFVKTHQRSIKANKKKISPKKMLKIALSLTVKK